MIASNHFWKAWLATVRGHRVEFFVAIGPLLLLGLLQLPAPLLTMRVLNAVTAVHPDVSPVPVLCAMLCIVFIFGLAVKGIQRIAVEKLRVVVSLSIQRLLLTTIFALPLDFHRRSAHGVLLAQLSTDPQTLESCLADSMLTIFSDVVTLTFGVGLLFYLDWKLATLAFVSVPASALLVWRLRINLKREVGILHKRTAALTAFFSEMLTNVFSVKTLVLQSTLECRHLLLTESLNQQRFSFQSTRVKYEALISCCSGLTPIIVLAYSAIAIAHHTLLVGRFVAFTGYMMYLYRPADSLALAILGIQESLAALDRIDSILKETSEESHFAHALTVVTPDDAVCIELCNVYVRYDPIGSWALQDVSCRFASGEVVGVVGPSGSGKSTLVNLLPLLIKPELGHIKLTGFNASCLTDLREHLAVVSQETMLFSGTILDNICLGRPCASREEVALAAKLACVDDFIPTGSDAYNSELFENGSRLSAGQRQRVMLARAILRKPYVLILDEATSCLDTSLELQVLSNLRSAAIPIIIVVSHRNSIRSFADRLYHIEAGRIVATEFTLRTPC